MKARHFAEGKDSPTGETVMETALILKIAGIGLLVTVACQILSRAGRDEQAMLVSVAGVIMVMVLLLDEMSGLISDLRSVFGF